MAPSPTDVCAFEEIERLLAGERALRDAARPRKNSSSAAADALDCLVLAFSMPTRVWENFHLVDGKYKVLFPGAVIQALAERGDPLGCACIGNVPRPKSVLHFNTVGNTFAFKGVYPALPALGEQQYLVTGSSTLQGSIIVHELDGDSPNYVLACFANNNVNASEYSTGALDVTAKTITWTGFFNETSTYSGDTLERCPRQEHPRRQRGQRQQQRQ